MQRVLSILLIAVLFFACAKRKIVVPETKETKQPAATEQYPKAIEPQVESTQAIIEQKGSDIESTEISGKPQEAKGYVQGKEKVEEIFRDLYFDYDRYYINDEYKPTLSTIANWMINNSSSRLVIEGHCDERGTNEYNLGLGDRRANAVKDYLQMLGVQKSRIETVSYGEEKPLCAEHGEECWSKNRRVHFVLMQGG